MILKAMKTFGIILLEILVILISLLSIICVRKPIMCTRTYLTICLLCGVLKQRAGDILDQHEVLHDLTPLQIAFRQLDTSLN